MEFLRTEFCGCLGKKNKEKKGIKKNTPDQVTGVTY